jgi:hypothetical protein
MSLGLGPPVVKSAKDAAPGTLGASDACEIINPAYPPIGNANPLQRVGLRRVLCEELTLSGAGRAGTGLPDRERFGPAPILPIRGRPLVSLSPAPINLLVNLTYWLTHPKTNYLLWYQK